MARERRMAVDPETAIVLWPSYFDSRISRCCGRRVPKKDAVEAPSARMVYDSVRTLGYDCILELEKAYPRYWFRREGRVLVEPKLSKSELIAKVAAGLRGLPGRE
ncbi:MAG: signal recognition particle protein Srp19 [Methanobacteriota archaeon]|nr:MAG: signal recognition particle protein Srp19 [Euryarchaeota archaeon]